MTSDSIKAASVEQPASLSWVSVGFFGAVHAIALLSPWFSHGRR